MTRDYEVPMAVRLTDSDRAFGACTTGSTPTTVCLTGTAGSAVGYRVRGFDGVCVTGKSATDGCYAGVG